MSMTPIATLLESTLPPKRPTASKEILPWLVFFPILITADGSIQRIEIQNGGKVSFRLDKPRFILHSDKVRFMWQWLQSMRRQDESLIKSILELR
jgi:hypothetical protein